MATSVHIPPPLLEAVDRKARVLQISRNRFIVQALEHELTRVNEWSPGFFEQLTPLSDADARAFDETMAAVGHARKSKRPPEF